MYFFPSIMEKEGSAIMKIRESVFILAIMGVLTACGSGDAHQGNTESYIPLYCTCMPSA